jgi:UbiD family decarboxylase
MITPSNSPYTPDLRGFFEYLEKEHPEQVVRISREVDPKFGVSASSNGSSATANFPLVIFENVKGSKIPLVANMHASFERLRSGSAWSTAMSKRSSRNAPRGRPIRSTR